MIITRRLRIWGTGCPNEPICRVQLKREYRSCAVLTRVGSEPRSVVTPTCSLPTESASTHNSDKPSLLCHGQQIVPVDTLVVTKLIIIADSTSVDHDPARWVGFWVEQVVTFGTKVERSLEQRKLLDKPKRWFCKPSSIFQEF